VNARPSKCIEFDTIAGEKTEANEICIDNQYGTVVRAHVNGETISFSDFSPIARLMFRRILPTKRTI